MANELRQQEGTTESPTEALVRIEKLEQENDWESITSFTETIPRPLTPEWIRVADAVAFALGQLDETDRAAALEGAAFGLAPTRRRAGCLAYLYYDALLGRKSNRGKDTRDGEADRIAFRQWISEALRLEPGSIKDLYRLGVYEAQVEQRHDRAALRAFLSAIASWRDLPPNVRAHRGDLHKYFVKTLYAGARSALRLVELGWARQLIFECLRENEKRAHVAPLHALFLAGKVCFALARIDDAKTTDHRVDWASHAERAFRKALDADGPPRRDFIFTALANLALWRGLHDDAERWIEDHLPPHRRRPHEWRLTAEVRRAQGRPQEALLALQNSLKKDRLGRHLSLTTMGEIQLELGKAKEAERSFRKAQDFRRKKYLSDHRAALSGLVEALETRHRSEEADKVRTLLVAARAHEGLSTTSDNTRWQQEEGDERESITRAAV